MTLSKNFTRGPENAQTQNGQKTLQAAIPLNGKQNPSEESSEKSTTGRLQNLATEA